LEKVKEFEDFDILKVELQTPLETIFRIYDRNDFGEHFLLATTVPLFKIPFLHPR